MNSRTLSQTPFIILAGGLGTRLRPALPHVPKALAPVAGEPFLKILLELLYKKGARRIVLCLGYGAEKISESVRDIRYPDLEIEQSIEHEPLGTGGAVRLAAAYFSPRAVVLNGDTYFDFDYDHFYRNHLEQVERHGSQASLAVTRGRAGMLFGSIVLDAGQQCIMRFDEKSNIENSAIHWVNGGVYIMEKELVYRIPEARFVSLEREVFPSALQDGVRLSVFKEGGRFFDIGTPQSWKQFASHYMEKKA